MDKEIDLELNNLFSTERKCRVCGEIKELMDGFYLTHKNAGTSTSAYSYECKTCTIKRIVKTKRSKNNDFECGYPDW